MEADLVDGEKSTFLVTEESLLNRVLCEIVGEPAVVEKSEANSSSGGGHKPESEDLAVLKESKPDKVVVVVAVEVSILRTLCEGEAVELDDSV